MQHNLMFLTEVVNLIAVHCKVYSIKYYMLKVCQQIWPFSQGISLRGVLDKIRYVKSWSASWFFPQGISSIKLSATIVLKMSNTDPNKKNGSDDKYQSHAFTFDITTSAKTKIQGDILSSAKKIQHYII